MDLNNRSFGPGKGKNKKEAEQVAASIAYYTLTEQEDIDGTN